MLTVVRHGRTSFNTTDGEKMRGWLQLPLSDEGQKQGMQAADKLKSFNLDFKGFNTSPLKRAVQTSEHISDAIGKDFTKSNGLLDWDTGELTGKPVKDVLPTVHSYMDNPNKPIPDGESFANFLKRAVPFIKNLVESDGNHLAVTHNRVTTLIKALAASKGQEADINVLKKKGPVEPGGIMMINPDWSIDILDKGAIDDS